MLCQLLQRNNLDRRNAKDPAFDPFDGRVEWKVARRVVANYMDMSYKRWKWREV